MAEQEHWRKIQTISLFPEDSARLARLTCRAGSEGDIITPTVSFIVRVALHALEKLPDAQFQLVFREVPETRYGPDPKQFRETLSDKERSALLREFGVK